MERRTLLAILLIMAVLIGDQILMSRIWKKPPPAPPASSDSAVLRGVEGGAGSPAGAGAPVDGGKAPLSGATGASGTTASGTPTSGTPAPVAPAPGTAPVAGLTPATPGQAGAPGGRPALPAAPVVRREIRNEYFRAVFTSEGGAIESWILPRYPDLAHGDEVPVNLVALGERAMNVAVSTSHFDWDYRGEPFRLDEARSSDSSVTFVAEDLSGVRVTKSYRIAADPRALDVEIRIEVPAPYGAIQYRWGWWNALPNMERKPNPKERQAVALIGDKLESYDFEKLAKSGPKEFTGTVRWAGNRSKYFVAVLLPDSATVSSAYFTAAGGAPATKGEPTVTLNGAAPPGSQVIRRARLYAGPIHYETLVAQGAELDRLANLGWRWLMGLSALLLWSLNALYKVIPNYGIAIILLSIATKLVFYPLTQSSLRAMKLMHHLQPQVKALQEKYQGDPQKMNKAMMDLYKEHKVNPVAGCLPLLIQMPIFFALYNVLLNSIELRGAGFMGYIHDLSLPDVLFTIGGFPVHFLPVIMTASTYLMQAQTPVAPAQKPMMMIMPVMMLVFMYTFPSGVILYWTVTNVLSAAQQYIVNVAEDRKMAAQRA